MFTSQVMDFFLLNENFPLSDALCEIVSIAESTRTIFLIWHHVPVLLSYK